MMVSVHYLLDIIHYKIINIDSKFRMNFMYEGLIYVTKSVISSFVISNIIPVSTNYWNKICSSLEPVQHFSEDKPNNVK